MSRRAVFLDKDGTLIVNVPYNVQPSLIELVSAAGESLVRLHEAGYMLVVVSNQAGVGQGYFEEAALGAVQQRLAELLSEFDVKLDGFYYCPHHPEARLPQYRRHCNCRKPKPGLIRRAAADLDIDLASSWFVGDILDDVEAGNAAGCRSVLIDVGSETEWQMSARRLPDYHAYSIAEAVGFILAYEHLDNESLRAFTK